MSKTRKSDKPYVGVYSRCEGANAGPLFPLLYSWGYRFRTIDTDELLQLKPGDIDVLLLSGGWYFFEGSRKKAGKHLCDLVHQGMGAVGICCGQINLCKLGLVPADMTSMSGVGPTDLEPVDGKHPVLRGVAKKSSKSWRTWDNFKILRYNGWLMHPKDGAHMIAAYDLDKKVGAIVSSEPGKGRCVAISPHPEGRQCAPGEFADRDEHALVYDGNAMGTARIIDNALLWCARHRVKA